MRGNYCPPVRAHGHHRRGAARAVLGRAGEPGALWPSITDGDPVPASAFLTPDGKPGLQASYFNLEAGSPTARQAPLPGQGLLPHTVTHLQSLARDFPRPARTRGGLDGSSSPPRPAAARLGLAGIKGQLTVGGKPVVLAKRPTHWAEPVALTGRT